MRGVGAAFGVRMYFDRSDAPCTTSCWAEISPQIAVRIKIIRKEMRFFMIYFN